MPHVELHPRDFVVIDKILAGYADYLTAADRLTLEVRACLRVIDGLHQRIAPVIAAQAAGSNTINTLITLDENEVRVICGALEHCSRALLLHVPPSALRDDFLARVQALKMQVEKMLLT